MSTPLSIQFSASSDVDASLLLIDSQRQRVAGSLAHIATMQAKSEKLNFAGKTGQVICDAGDDAGPAVLAIGVGDDITSTLKAEKAGAALYAAMKNHKMHKASLDACDMNIGVLTSLLYGAMSQSYEFHHYFTSKDSTPEMMISVTCDDDKAAMKAFEDASAMLKGVFLARDLITEPANILHPETFAARCEALSVLGLEVEVLDEAAMAKLGMGALLGVGQGSRRESKMVIMKWQGGGDEAPLAYVGKGVCFDTGGISLKPAKGMEDMKWDMGGAAAVTGAMCAIASRKVKRNIIGLIGLVENMPDGNAQRPGDVVTSMSGQTIEVINTDAEGRLVLADCLTYVQQNYKPQMIVDLATLTGAIIVALGKEYAGLFANDEALSAQIIAAGQATEEKCWQMPIGETYHKSLKSHIADMKNIGGPWGGSITAACFLEKFVDDGTPWAHIDMAGKAWADSAGHAHPAGGTGFGVRLLNHLADNWQDKSVKG